MSHIFDRYFTKHGHYPRVVVDNGIQRLTVEFCPGYLRIATSLPYQANIYITRSTFLRLLKRLVPLARMMAKNPHPDHDVPAAEREAYQLELSILEEKRAVKKAQSHTLEDAKRQERQRARFLKARERAARRHGT